MANPKLVGTFDYWITDRMMFLNTAPRTGSTGDFEKWLWDRQYWPVYQSTAAAGPTNFTLRNKLVGPPWRIPGRRMRSVLL